MKNLKRENQSLWVLGIVVYKNFDPRANIIKGACDDLLEDLEVHNEPLLEISKKFEAVALNDEYFTSRKLYSNVDFYSGIILKALNLPSEMFTVFFAFRPNAGVVCPMLRVCRGS